MRSEFGERLFTARKRAALTQAQLAMAVGTSQANIGELEKKGHGSALTPAIAARCGVPVEWLAYGHGDIADAPTPPPQNESGLDYWLSKIPRSHPLHERIKRNCMLIIIQGINAVDTPPAMPEPSIDDAVATPIESHHNQPARRKTAQT